MDFLGKLVANVSRWRCHQHVRIPWILGRWVEEKDPGSTLLGFAQRTSKARRVLRSTDFVCDALRVHAKACPVDDFVVDALHEPRFR
ncbi:hypothetical protein PISMIDRAFT_674775 [Pisolithus microcarpus 441]|uniref:Uncharacterized protein n=1 Tax=Pisolithus microcarpus 441 TaxID=765257 RepID=A0A0C9ZYY5_9AGAM|nr:hypothetical protein PISMIDRAFT_674775 [Pisolithus microcarpus 441]